MANPNLRRTNTVGEAKEGRGGRAPTPVHGQKDKLHRRFAGPEATVASTLLACIISSMNLLSIQVAPGEPNEHLECIVRAGQGKAKS